MEAVDRLTVAAKLREQLKKDLVNRYRVGERLPSERQLARIHNVAPVTISRVMQQLSNDGIVYRVPSSGTYLCDSVDQAAQQGPDPRPREDAVPQRTHEPVVPVTLIVAPLAGGSTTAHAWEVGRLHQLMSAAERRIQSQGGSTYVVDFDHPGPPSLSEQLKRLIDDGANSVIVLPRFPGLAEPVYRELLKLREKTDNRVPIVVARLENRIKLFDNVRIDSSAGVFRAVRHLAANGHRRIACALPALPSEFWIAERLDGFRLGCEIEGIADIDSHVFYSDPQLVFDTDPRRPGHHCGRNVAEAIFRAGGYTAIVAANDNMAAGIMETASERGYKVPNDLAIVGYDDVTVSRVHRLTTVHPPIEQIGDEAARVVQARLNEPRASEFVPRDVRLEPTLVIRESTRITIDG